MRNVETFLSFYLGNLLILYFFLRQTRLFGFSLAYSLFIFFCLSYAVELYRQGSDPEKRVRQIGKVAC